MLALSWIVFFRGWPFYFTIFGRSITIDSDRLPAVIILYAIIVTTIWSYIFLLWPIAENRTFKGQHWCIRYLFQGLLVLSFIVSLGLSIYYFLAASDPSLTAVDSLKELAKIAGPFANFARAIHLVFFIFVYSLIDLLIAHASKGKSGEGRFASIFWFIDIPIFLTMLFVTTILGRILDDKSFYIFEAGVVSFQLIAGSLSVVGLEYFDELALASSPESEQQ